MLVTNLEEARVTYHRCDYCHEQSMISVDVADHTLRPDNETSWRHPLDEGKHACPRCVKDRSYLDGRDPTIPGMFRFTTVEDAKKGRWHFALLPHPSDAERAIVLWPADGCWYVPVSSGYTFSTTNDLRHGERLRRIADGIGLIEIWCDFQSITDEDGFSEDRVVEAVVADYGIVAAARTSRPQCFQVRWRRL